MSLLLFLDYLGIIVFAITGALVAAEQEHDIISFMMLGTVTGIGGGTVRDILLNRDAIFWIDQPIYLTLCVVTSCVMFFVARFISRFNKPILWGDALGISIFTITGTQIALTAGVHPMVAILMGIITATFGGIIRDVLSMRESLVMRKEIYATACFTGALVYILFTQFSSLDQIYHLWISAACVFALRAAAIIYDLRLPGYKWIHNKGEPS